MTDDFENFETVDPEMDFGRKRDELLGEIEGVKNMVQSLYNTKSVHDYEPKNQNEIDWAIADVYMSISSLMSLMDRQSKAWDEYHQERLGILPKKERDPDIPF